MIPCHTLLRERTGDGSEFTSNLNSLSFNMFDHAASSPYITSPPPPGVGLLRCLRGGPRSRRGAPGVPACGSPLHGQQPGTRRLFEASGSRSLRRRRSSGNRGVTLLPPTPRPPPPASPAWRSGILPSRRKRRGIAVQPARARAALRQ